MMFQFIIQQPFFSIFQSKQFVAIRVYNAETSIMKTKRHIRFLNSLVGVDKTFYMFTTIKQLSDMKI